MPDKGITITLTVTGLSKDAGVQEETTTPEPSTPTEPAPSGELPKTGGLPGELIYVTGFAVASLGVFLKVRKDKKV